MESFNLRGNSHTTSFNSTWCSNSLNCSDKILEIFNLHLCVCVRLLTSILCRKCRGQRSQTEESVLWFHHIDHTQITHRSQGSKLDCGAWWQVPVPIELVHWLQDLFLFTLVFVFVVLFYFLFEYRVPDLRPCFSYASVLSLSYTIKVDKIIKL